MTMLANLTVPEGMKYSQILIKETTAALHTEAVRVLIDAFDILLFFCR